MKIPALVFIAAALVLAACSGNFNTGTNMPNTIPPVNASSGPMGMPGEQPSPGTETLTSKNESGYPLTQAPDGFPCPAQNGFSCTLRFNMPPPTPTPAPQPKGKKAKPTPTPTPTPTPSPSPSPDQSGAPAPTATPSPEGSMAVKMDAMPKDAPSMVHVPEKALNVVALMQVTLTPSADFALTGPAQAQFTLPKSQLDGRGFAMQLFQRTTHKKKHTDKAIWTFDKSTRQENTLTFDFTPPKMTVPKGSTYLLVLYGDDRPATPAPAASGSAAPATAAPSSSPAPSASPSTAP